VDSAEAFEDPQDRHSRGVAEELSRNFAAWKENLVYLVKPVPGSVD
jgi:hypothetical protein